VGNGVDAGEVAEWSGVGMILVATCKVPPKTLDHLLSIGTARYLGRQTAGAVSLIFEEQCCGNTEIGFRPYLDVPGYLPHRSDRGLLPNAALDFTTCSSRFDILTIPIAAKHPCILWKLVSQSQHFSEIAVRSTNPTP
jgi:hypothetical protein